MKMLGMRSLRITAALLGSLAASLSGTIVHAQVSGIGATRQPMVYVNVSGHARQLVWNGITFYWHSQFIDGVAAPVGVVHHGPGEKPWAYVLLNDNTVWGIGGMGGSGSVWQPDFRGRPTGVGIDLPLGACSGDSGGNRGFTFVRGTDGNVWSNDGVTGWFNQGTPGVSIAARVGATTVHGTRPYLFVVGSDGGLWLRWWTGSAWQWSSQGKPGGGLSITGSVGVTTISGNRPFAFVTASDGNLWSHSWSGSSWGWYNHGRPTTGISSGNLGKVGVANAGHDGRPYAFVVSTDGNLWSQGWSGRTWQWENHGIPGGGAITASIGAVGVDGDRPYAYVMASDGRLWQRWWTGSTWSWTNQGTPPY